ncbi:MAG: fatty acid--CoA ligase family protein [Burkholderiales bacterium]
MNVTTALRAHAARAPQHIAFAGLPTPVLTYAALERAVDVVATRLATLGLRAGDTAVLATRDTVRQLVAGLALARLGVAQAGPSFPAAFVSMTLADDPAEVAAHPNVAPLASVMADAFTASAAPVPLHDDPDAILMHAPSSGTTGAVKHVPITQALAQRRAARRAAEVAGVPLREGQALRLACHIGLQSTFGMGSVLHVLDRGGTLLAAELDAARIASWLLHARVSYLVTSPIGLARMLDALPAQRTANVLDAIEVGGAALAPAVLGQVRERLGAVVFVGYGLTECGRVAGGDARRFADVPGAVGVPYPDVELMIRDDAGAAVPDGQAGIVWVRSPRNATGYFADPVASAAVFQDGWVRTNDWGSVGDGGVLRILGRADDVINRDGVKIDPAWVERSLVALGGIDEAAAFGVPHGGGVALCAAVVAKAAPFNLDAFHARCRRTLGTRAPDLLVQVQALPRNANGKVERAALVRLVQASPAAAR